MNIGTYGVIGAGSWGTALSLSLARGAEGVLLWGHRAEHVEVLALKRENAKYLPGIPLLDNLTTTHCAADLAVCEVVFFVVPTVGFRKTAMRFMQEAGFSPSTILVSCSKGIESGSSCSMSEILREIFPCNPVGVLSGPNHAEEVARLLPTAAVAGATEPAVAEKLQSVVNRGWFRCYSSCDVGGIEWAGAMKNVFAIAAGICEGLGLGDNARAALLTRALAEMVRLGTSRGGQIPTFYGLSGVGDLVATCYSAHSRNTRVGRALATGRPLREVVASLGMVAEGVVNTKNLYEYARAHGIRTPIIDACYAMLYEERPPRDVLEELLSRDPRSENS